MTNLSKLNRKTGGFSLIEVLIAVLVLATGMLALAALQSALIRNSVDAKNRSQAMSIAVDTIERVRQNTGANITDYENLPVGQTAWTAWAPPAGVAGVGANYSADYESRRNVTRYVRESNQAVCGGEDVTPCFRVAGAADAPQEGVAEFKRIDIEVRWTDPQDNVRTVSTSDIVGSVTDDKTSVIMDQTGQPSSGIGEPVSRIPKPSDAGIIPIAVGDGQETAASNPKPITGRERGRTDETQFQVLTYAVEAGNVARLNRIIDNRVIGCRCTLSAASAVVDETILIGTPVQPTFWDGAEYVEPEAVANVKEGERGAPSDDTVQSNLCTTCCMDHHDRASNAIRVDPFRTDEYPHEHYNDPDESDTTIQFAKANSGDGYYEACRLIRVNGIFRVATDMRLDLMNLLETDELANESLPRADKIPIYQNAVKDFVKQRVVDGTQNPDMSAFPAVFVDPDLMNIEVPKTRYMHNRGLYIDHLETPAQEALTKALAECPGSKPKVDCALAVLPFVSINTTEIAQWASESAISGGDAHVQVSNWSLRPVCPNNDPYCSEPPPARGATRALSDGEDGSIASMQRSNSGVSDSLPVDPQDADLSPYSGEIFRDEQAIYAEGCALTPSFLRVKLNGGGNFQLAQSVQQVEWQNTLYSGDTCESLLEGSFCSGNIGNNGSFANPFTCNIASDLLPPQPGETEIVLHLAGYNRILAPSTIPNNQKVDDPCSNSPGDKVGFNICQNWRIDTVKVGTLVASTSIDYLPVEAQGTYVRDGGFGERAVITLKHNLLDPQAIIDVNFVLQSELKMTGVSCELGAVVYPPCPSVAPEVP